MVKIVSYLKSLRNLNLIYACMVFTCLVFLMLIALTFNRAHTSEYTISIDPLANYHIDSCLFEQGRVRVVGWAFTLDNPNILNKVFVFKNTGERIELFSAMQRRPDVSNYFKSPHAYDKSGFDASKIILNQNDYSQEVEIISLDKKGEWYAAKYLCK